MYQRSAKLNPCLNPIFDTPSKFRVTPEGQGLDHLLPETSRGVPLQSSLGALQTPGPAGRFYGPARMSKLCAVDCRYGRAHWMQGKWSNFVTVATNDSLMAER